MGLPPARDPSPELQAALRAARAVVFVCSGNMVRSAFAELWARELELALPAISLATTFRNERILPQTERALRVRGVAAERIAAFRPTHVDDLGSPWKERLSADDTLVFGMAPAHLAALASRGVKARLLEELRGAPEPIADPVLEGASFEDTFERIEACVAVLVERVRGRSPQAPQPIPGTLR